MSRTARPLLVTLLGLTACPLVPEADVGGVTMTGSEASTLATEDPVTTNDGVPLDLGATSGQDDGFPLDLGATSGADPSEGDDDADVVKLDVSATTGEAEDTCADAPDVIYVMLPSTPTEIWSYDPVLNEFGPYATVTCPEIEGEPTGFSVERSGDLLMLSLEPEDPALIPDRPMQLTRVDPMSGSCDVVEYAPIIGNYGIDCADVALVSMPGDPDHERLLAHSCTGGGFAHAPGSGMGQLFRADPQQPDPSFLFLQADDYSSVALAGTGDGRLYGVGGDQRIPGVGQILEYDHESGALLSSLTVPELDIGDQGGYIALAFYGGDLYAFGLDALAGSLQINRYDLDDDDGNGLHEVTAVPIPAGAPGGIVAAASPTCIPLTPAG